MNELQIFSNENFGKLRTSIVDGEPWFVAADVCKALEIANPTDGIKRLDADEKARFNLGLSGGSTNCVNEYGLYTLVLGSRKPEAKAFKRWITHEVIPAIRKHGGYLTPEKVEEALLDPDTIIQLATQLKAERAKRHSLEAETAKQAQLIGEMKPKATYYDLVLSSKDLVAITQIAKDYGMSGKQLNAKLHELGVQYKLGNQWLLYARYHDKGYTHSETIHFKHSGGRADTKLITKWTQAGRLFLYDLLKNENILPVIERDKSA